MKKQDQRQNAGGSGARSRALRYQPRKKDGLNLENICPNAETLREDIAKRRVPQQNLFTMGPYYVKSLKDKEQHEDENDQHQDLHDDDHPLVLFNNFHRLYFVYRYE